jgi:uncharacterized protein (UPF0303 family)
MNMQELNDVLVAQNKALRFSRFDEETVWHLGSVLKQLAERDGLSLAFEIRWSKETAFSYSMAGCTPANADWIRRKRNTVELLHESSYAVGRACMGIRAGILEEIGLSRRDFAAHGGGFPLRGVTGSVFGVVTTSGAKDFIDHNIAIEAIATVCGTKVPLLSE